MPSVLFSEYSWNTWAYLGDESDSPGTVCKRAMLPEAHETFQGYSDPRNDKTPDDVGARMNQPEDAGKC